MSPDDKIAKVMSEFHAGTLRSSSGQPVTSKRQAMAIALSEAGMSQDGWITVHPNGEGSKGVPVLLGPDGTVQGGMGGKFNGKKINQLGNGGNNMTTASKLDQLKSSGNAFAKMAVMAHPAKIKKYLQAKEKYDKIASSNWQSKSRTYMQKAKDDMITAKSDVERSEGDIIDRADAAGIKITQSELRKHFTEAN